MRQTKIIATVGPASDTEENLRAMIEAGADTFRFNMSHALHENVARLVPRIRSIAAELGIAVDILLDTQGPAIRTADLPVPLHLEVGDILELTIPAAPPAEPLSVAVNYDGLAEDLSAGDTVLLDNGLLRLEVLDKAADRIRCRVLTPGTLGSRRHVNLPGVKVRLPALTAKDLEDVAFAAALGADIVSLSFCREAADIDALRAELARHGSRARVVAKIEDRSGVHNIDAIIARADAVMIARGDLGIECPMEELPIIQRAVTRKCLRAARPVIVATELLESMTARPIPTRAEVTDVANAVFERVDALMLSGETTMGRHPVQCVETLDRIARRIERSRDAGDNDPCLCGVNEHGGACL